MTKKIKRSESAKPAKPAKPPKPEKPPKKIVWVKPSKIVLPDFYFASGTGAFWLDVNGRFLKLGEKDVKRHLQFHGCDNMDRSDGLSTLDYEIVVAQRERSVDYAGPIGGNPVGVLRAESGEKILVTTEANPLPVKAGDCELWEKFITTLLPDDQWMRLVLWLKFARRAQKAMDYQPGQAFILAGEGGCGKSFLQNMITPLLGGRHALPYRYMTNQTTFNEDLAGSEHWMIEDKCCATDINSRRMFGSALKEATVNKYFSIHPKGKQAIPLAIFRRVSITVNFEPENLMVIPPLDNSILDKIIALKCASARECFTGSFANDWKAYTAQLPAFAAFIDKCPLPKKWADTRFGVAAWHHPEILDVLNEMSQEAKLLELIDQIVFAKNHAYDETAWTGSAAELEMKLRENKDCAWQIERILRYPSACGTFLGRLVTKSGNRIEARKNEGKTRWIIKAP